MEQKAEGRAADVLRPGHLEAREPHRVDVARGAVRDVRHFAVVGNDDCHRVLADRGRTLLGPVLERQQHEAAFRIAMRGGGWR